MRQLVTRARAHVSGGRRRASARPASHGRLLDAPSDASRTGDLTKLERILVWDVASSSEKRRRSLRPTARPRPLPADARRRPLGPMFTHSLRWRVKVEGARRMDGDANESEASRFASYGLTGRCGPIKPSAFAHGRTTQLHVSEPKVGLQGEATCRFVHVSAWESSTPERRLAPLEGLADTETDGDVAHANRCLGGAVSHVEGL